jgi:hypothetical protein
MSFFEFNFESWFVYLFLILLLILFLLVLHKYYNIFNLLESKKTVINDIEPEKIEIEADDADIDSDNESDESDPLHITLRAAEMYYERGDTEKAMELWNTIVIEPLPEKIEEIIEPEPEKESTDFANTETNLFKFPDEIVAKKDWKTSPSLNAYIQILMKNIKEEPEHSTEIINNAKEFIKTNFSEFNLPVIFSNVL